MNNRFDDDNLRPLSQLEREYLDRLLSAEFTGRAELIEQVRSARVRTIDSDGSIQIEPHTTTLATVVNRIPVEAEATDEDGVPIYFLLHAVDGRVQELEIYKADGSLIRKRPSAEELQVVVLAP